MIELSQHFVDRSAERGVGSEPRRVDPQRVAGQRRLDGGDDDILGVASSWCEIADELDHDADVAVDSVGVGKGFEFTLFALDREKRSGSSVRHLGSLPMEPGRSFRASAWGAIGREREVAFMIVAGERSRFQRLNEWREKRKELCQIATGGCELFRICVGGS